jgi:ATP-binding cassette, subfamily B (MDR/TAP), member 1
LVGPSGSGKSTIIGLLERWYNTDATAAGQIQLDGLQIQALNLAWLRRQIRLVQQEPVLFSGTIFENVAFGLEGTEYTEASEEKKRNLVEEACKDAYAHDFIQALPKQYETEIGERARTLSGGQKQRLAIARSIVSRPAVLLLDEATSALDPNAERIVQRALDNISVGRTTIMIAHKLSTVQRADTIAVMSAGRIVEQGTHSQLLSRDGAYARLVRSQDLEKEAATVVEERELSDPETVCEKEEDEKHPKAAATTVSLHASALVQPSGEEKEEEEKEEEEKEEEEKEEEEEGRGGEGRGGEGTFAGDYGLQSPLLRVAFDQRAAEILGRLHGLRHRMCSSRLVPFFLAVLKDCSGVFFSSLC